MINLVYNKSGQNTAEYALLIALVIAGVIAMQTYSQRSLQARVKDASKYMSTETEKDESGAQILGKVQQYEPYYLESKYETDRVTEDQKMLAESTTAAYSTSNRVRKDDGYQQSNYGGDNL